LHIRLGRIEQSQQLRVNWRIVDLCKGEYPDCFGAYDICPLCFWEGDGQDDHDADMMRGGPNGKLSLTEARHNFAAIGACQERFLPNVRKALPEES
jgi:hypothetical protein